MIITMANLKGGTGKTTSACYLAHAFAQLGSAVLIVDADPQASILEWAEEADWDIPTMGLPAKNLHRRLPGIAGDRYDVVIIDTPGRMDPGANGYGLGIVTSALRAADLILVPMAPTMMELAKVERTAQAIEDVAGLRDDDAAVRVLLNRTIPNASSTGVIREELTVRGWDVLAAEIPRRESIAQAVGAPLGATLHGYLSVAYELLDLELKL